MQKKRSELATKILEVIDSLSVDPELKEQLKNTIKSKDIQDTAIDYWVALILVTKIYADWHVAMVQNSMLAQFVILCEQKARPAIPIIDKTLAALDIQSTPNFKL